MPALDENRQSPPTFFVRRKLYEKFGDFRLDLGSAADYELMLRLLLKHEAPDFGGEAFKEG